MQLTAQHEKHEKFIPGPWKYDPLTRIVTANNGKRYIACADINMRDQDFSEQEEATAKVIAKAPEMYYLLKYIMTYELATHDACGKIKMIIDQINA